MASVKIDCYLSMSCGSEYALRENISKALDLEKASGEVSFHRIDEAQAEALGVHGSPSLFVEGEEVDPLTAAPGFS